MIHHPDRFRIRIPVPMWPPGSAMHSPARTVSMLPCNTTCTIASLICQRYHHLVAAAALLRL
jgi:hypothetical protein